MTRCAAALVCWAAASTAFAAPPMRKPLDAGQRVAVLALMKATDAAQVSGLAAGSDAGLQWESAAFKSTDGRTYVPFRVTPATPLASSILVGRVPAWSIFHWLQS